MNDWITALTALGLVLSPALLKLADASGADSTDAAAPQRMCVDQENAPVHRAFRGRSDVVAHLDVGDVVHVVAERENWNQVVFVQDDRAELGWIVDRHVETCEDSGDAESGPELGPTDASPEIVPHAVSSVDDLPTSPPSAGDFRVHLIDVGTGLAVLVQGHDFNLLFDGGSSDDKSGITANGNGSRLVSYLYAAIGPSGPSKCIPDGDAGYGDYAGDADLKIDHVFLSHPHDDHGSLLDDVLTCYRVENVWDAGVINDKAFYRDFVAAVAAESEVQYHTAAEVPDDRTMTIVDEDIVFPTAAEWTTFATGDDAVRLGAGAKFRVLYADGVLHGDDFNMNSLVLRVDLGGRSLLLTGDEEAGQRINWADRDPESGTPEAALVEEHGDLLQVDILQVPHHGSKTSSRMAFLDAVRPTWALVGDGPKLFSGVDLPDTVVVDAIRSALANGSPRPVDERLLMTNVHDADGCPIKNRIGRDNGNPGGCDNWYLEISGD